MKLKADRTVTVKLENGDLVTAQAGEVVDLPEKYLKSPVFSKLVEQAKPKKKVTKKTTKKSSKK